jgi:hypothetical protein
MEDYLSNEVGRGRTSGAQKASPSSDGGNDDSNSMTPSMRHLEDASDGAPTITPDTTSQTFRASANISTSDLATTTDAVSQSYRTASTNESADGLATTTPPEVSILSSFRVKPDGIVFAAVSSVEVRETNDLAGNDDPEY